MQKFLAAFSKKQHIALIENMSCLDHQSLKKKLDSRLLLLDKHRKNDKTAKNKKIDNKDTKVKKIVDENH